MEPAAVVTVRAYLPDGRLKAAWEGRLLARSGVWAVLAVWNRPPVDVGALQFHPGDRLIEVFWADRWWNVMRVAAPSGHLRGYYINLATPVRSRPSSGPRGGWELAYVDGALDAVITPGGRWQWLDRDAFRGLVGMEAGAAAGLAARREPFRLPSRREPQRGRQAGWGGRGWPGHGSPGTEAGPVFSGAAQGAPPATRDQVLIDRRSPHPAQWVAAARELGRRLGGGAAEFVRDMAPWDDWIRRLPPAQNACGLHARPPRAPDGEDGCGP